MLELETLEPARNQHQRDSRDIANENSVNHQAHRRRRNTIRTLVTPARLSKPATHLLSYLSTCPLRSHDSRNSHSLAKANLSTECAALSVRICVYPCPLCSRNPCCGDQKHPNFTYLTPFMVQRLIRPHRDSDTLDHSNYALLPSRLSERSGDSHYVLLASTNVAQTHPNTV